MRKVVLAGCAVLLVFAGSGCRFKGWESFTTATEPNPPADWKGDPYSYASSAKQTGGLVTKTNYGAGADENSPAPVDPKFDQPSKGSGQAPGEYPNVATPGMGRTNAPAAQPQPGDVTDANTLAHG